MIAPGRGCAFQNAAVQRNLGPTPGAAEQPIGDWFMPPNLYKNFRDPVYDARGNLLIDPTTGLPFDCVPDGIGAPVVTCTVAFQLSQGAPAQQPSAAQIAGNGVQPDSQNADMSAAKLRVIYGSGDADFATFDMDLIDGCSFPLIARSCRFYLVYPIETAPQIPGGSTEWAQPRLDVSVSIGLGSKGSAAFGASPRLSVPVGTLAGTTAGAVFPIPKMAVSVCYADTTQNAAPLFTQLVAPLAGGLVKSVAPLSKNETQRVPIAHGARGWFLTGGDGGNTALDAIFFLSPA